MSKLFVGCLAVLSIMTMGNAQAAQQVKVECMKRLSDGDVHADVSKYPAFTSGFKVISFKANRKSSEWSYGSCVLAPR